MEHASINGSSHQVVGSSDGMNVTSEMQVKLNKTDAHEPDAKVLLYLY